MDSEKTSIDLVQLHDGETKHRGCNIYKTQVNWSRIDCATTVLRKVELPKNVDSEKLSIDLVELDDGKTKHRG